MNDMSNELEFACVLTSELTPTQKHDYIAYLAESKPPLEYSQAVFRWLYEDNIYGDSIHVLVYHEGKLVARRSMWRNDLREDVVAYQPIDTFVSPSMRRRGVFREMTNRVLEHVGDAFIYNYPNHNSRPGYLKMGWVPWEEPDFGLYMGLKGSVGQALFRHEPAMSKDFCEWRFCQSPENTYFFARSRGHDLVLARRGCCRYLALGYVEQGGAERLSKVRPPVLFSRCKGPGLIRLKRLTGPVVVNSIFRDYDGTISYAKSDCA
jgi:GNAT superfamily N-acetyltransferase